MFSDAIIELFQKTFAYKRCKSLRKKVFSASFAILAGFFWYLCYYPISREMLCLPYAGFVFLKVKMNMKGSNKLENSATSSLKVAWPISLVSLLPKLKTHPKIIFLVKTKRSKSWFVIFLYWHVVEFEFEFDRGIF